MAEKEEFDRLLQKAAEVRGHLCSGLPLGVKMAQMGLKLLNLTEDEKSEKLVVFMETDACPAEAIKVATGCNTENGKLKIVGFGMSAATFVDGSTGKGIRVTPKQQLAAYALELGVKDNLVKAGDKVEKDSKLERQLRMHAYMKMPPEELLDYQAVRITVEGPILPIEKKASGHCGCGCGGVAKEQASKLYYEPI